MRQYDIYLNKKSILDCETENDIKQHGEEIAKGFEILQEKADSGAVIRIAYNDPGHRNSKPVYIYAAAEDYIKVFDRLDSKNGVDFVINKNELCAFVYGQNYTLYDSKEKCMVEANAEFRFIDKNQAENIKIFKECLNFLDNSELKQEFLGIVYKKSDFFKSFDRLFENELNFSSMNNKPSLSYIVKEAEERRNHDSIENTAVKYINEK